MAGFAQRWRNVKLGTIRTARWLLLAGYAWDWMLALALIIINFTVPGTLIPTVDRIYIPGDPALSYPQVHSWLTERQKFLIELGVPLATVALVQVFTRSWVDWHHFALSLIEAFAIESSFKKWMNLVGKPRPDWFARLASSDPDNIRNGRTSYPSGHAAETFMAFGLLSIYLLARLKLFTTPTQGHFAKVIVCLLPLGFAAFITLSRVAAYKHDFADINAGMFIGLCSAMLAYLVNYHNPLDAVAAAQPRMRPIPPAPGWLKRWLGEEAELHDVESLRQPLTSSN